MNANALRWIDDWRSWQAQDEEAIGAKVDWKTYMAYMTMATGSFAKGQWQHAGDTANAAKLDALLSNPGGGINIPQTLNHIADNMPDSWRAGIAPDVRKFAIDILKKSIRKS